MNQKEDVENKQPTIPHVSSLCEEDEEIVRNILGFRNVFVQIQHVGINILVPAIVDVLRHGNSEELEVKIKEVPLLDVPYPLSEKDVGVIQRFRTVVRLSEVKGVIHYLGNQDNHNTHAFAFYTKSAPRIGKKPNESPILYFLPEDSKTSNPSGDKHPSSSGSSSASSSYSSSDVQNSSSDIGFAENPNGNKGEDDSPNSHPRNNDNGVLADVKPDAKETQGRYSSSPDDMELYIVYHGFLRNVNMSKPTMNVWIKYSGLKEVVVIPEAKYEDDELFSKLKPKNLLQKLYEVTGTESIDVKEYKKKKEKAIKALNETGENENIVYVNKDIWRINYLCPFMIPTHLCLSLFDCEEASSDYTKYDSLDGKANPYYRDNANVKSLGKFVPDYYEDITPEPFTTVGPLVNPFLMAVQSLLLTYTHATGDRYIQGFSDISVSVIIWAFLEITKYNIKKRINRHNFLTNNSIKVLRSIDGCDLITVDDFIKVRKGIPISKLVEIEARAYGILSTILVINKDRFLFKRLGQDTDFVRKYALSVTEPYYPESLGKEFTYESVIQWFLLCGIRQMKDEIETAKVMLFLMEKREEFDMRISCLVMGFLKILEESRPTTGLKLTEKVPFIDGTLEACEAVKVARQIRDLIKDQMNAENGEQTASGSGPNPVEGSGGSFDHHGAVRKGSVSGSVNGELDPSAAGGLHSSSRKSDNPLMQERTSEPGSFRAGVNANQRRTSSCVEKEKSDDGVDSIMEKMESSDESDGYLGGGKVGTKSKVGKAGGLMAERPYESFSINEDEGSKYKSDESSDYTESSGKDHSSHSGGLFDSDDEL